MAVRLRRFIPAAPEEFLQGPLGEWVIIILLVALFIAISGAVLPKRLTERRYGKALVICTGLLLGVGLYMAKDLYNFNFESFGFMSIWLIAVLLGMVAFGLFRYGMKPDIAFALTYCVLFLSFSLIAPSLLDSIAQSFPLLNGVFFICFIYLGGRILFKIFGGKESLGKDAKDLWRDKFTSKEDHEEIDRELDIEKRDEKRLKKKTIKLTKREVNTIDDISQMLQDILNHLKNHSRLEETDFQEISKLIYNISIKKKDFENSLVLLRRHFENYRREDTKLLQELRGRLSKTEIPLEKEEIKRQYAIEKKKIDICEFTKVNEARINNFLQNFQALLFKAIENIKQNNIPNAAIHLTSAKNILGTIEKVLKQLKAYEKYLLKLSRKEEHILKKEEKGK
ncbi:MAG: hypothetical protein JRJ00_16595 [Deltaproteobacteria bacterium]|nr:hypothetical protein [Deltaproteobacteria bacterium]